MPSFNLNQDDPNDAPLWVKSLVLIVGGALFGALIMLMQQRLLPGLAIMVISMLIGAVLALPSVSASRTGRLLFGMLVAKNIPNAGSKAFDWVDDADSEVVADPIGKRFGKWVFPPCDRPRHWLMLLGLLAGAVTGVWLVVHDVLAICDGKPGTFIGARQVGEKLYFQAGAWAIGSPIWGGMLAGLIASRRYRRPQIATCLLLLILAAPIAASMAVSGVEIEELIGLFLAVAAVPLGGLLLVIYLGDHALRADKPPEKRPKRLFEDRPPR
ncbi:hypothetical protein [Blastopirellula marina]|uniref:Uncharacterized protein n=1 Tax=Blastopirellula marina DSM 3645 TaxID=314230 RepID=A3ZM65_9BACT|nr:hypothetical protein [Blastopirellula marina]EAQ82848.1 hypothetical protein DSM3645_10622 [Blastopirellula marina DSM 3645]